MDSSTKKILIAALVPSAAVAIICICFLVFYLTRYRKNQQQVQSKSSNQQPRMIEEGDAETLAEGGEKTPKLSLSLSIDEQVLTYPKSPITKVPHPIGDDENRIWAQYIHVCNVPSSPFALPNLFEYRKNVSKSSLIDYIGTIRTDYRESTLVGSGIRTPKRPSLPVFDTGSRFDIDALEKTIRRMTSHDSFFTDPTVSADSHSHYGANLSGDDFDDASSNGCSIAGYYNIISTTSCVATAPVIPYSPFTAGNSPSSPLPSIFSPAISQITGGKAPSTLVEPSPNVGLAITNTNVIPVFESSRSQRKSQISSSTRESKRSSQLTTTTSVSSQRCSFDHDLSTSFSSSLNMDNKSLNSSNPRESMGGASWIFLSPQTIDSSNISFDIESVASTPVVANKRLSYNPRHTPALSLSRQSSRRPLSLPRQKPRVASGGSLFAVAFPALPPTGPASRVSTITSAMNSSSLIANTADNYPSSRNEDRVRSWSHALSIASLSSLVSVVSNDSRPGPHSSLYSINMNTRPKRHRRSSVLSFCSEAVRRSPELEPVTKTQIKDNMTKRNKEISSRLRRVLYHTKSFQMFGPPPRICKTRKSRTPMRYRCHHCTFVFGS
ncbi:hypothetical protein H4219_000858 [Mycoemilia scoparia]|uniref:Uncharacterized protein n=1 Tax=Mycoemilia scoparia TaxID=417184 RepID=A0A9W8DWX7_9FUNG|nr:hypothetical protein H4219_000858 [Mycoemilia scoparia]